MNDPRVLAVLTHADECRAAARSGEEPPLPENLRDLSGINLSYAILTGAKLSGAILRSANLLLADLSRADLSGAVLGAARLSYAELTGAKVTQDQLNGAVYRDIVDKAYAKEVAEKFILFRKPEPGRYQRKLKKSLVVELLADGKLHIETPILEY